MAQLSQACLDKLGAFIEISEKVNQILGIIDDVSDLVGSVSNIVSGDLTGEDGQFGVEDLGALQELGNNLAGAVTATANLANNVAEATGNEAVVDFDKARGAADLLILANPAAMYAMIQNIAKQLGNLVTSGGIILNNLLTSIQEFKDAIVGVDEKREELDERNRQLKEQMVSLLILVLEDISEITKVSGTKIEFTPNASLEQICEDLLNLSNVAVPEADFSDIMRALAAIVENLSDIGDLIDNFFQFFDRLLNYESNFRNSISPGLLGVKLKLIKVLEQQTLDFVDRLNAIDVGDDLQLNQAARDLQLSFLWIRELLCRDGPDLQSRIDNDPNAGALGNLIAALEAIGLEDVATFRDQISDITQRVRAAVVRTDDQIIQFLDDVVDLIGGVIAVFQAVSAALTTFNPADIEQAFKSIENLFESNGFDRLRQLIDFGDFDEYFDTIVDTASAAADLAACVSNELGNFTGATKSLLTRAVTDLNGVNNAQRARANALAINRSNNIKAQRNSNRKVQEINRVITRNSQ